jgi:hypothetical protein
VLLNIRLTGVMRFLQLGLHRCESRSNSAPQFCPTPGVRANLAIQMRMLSGAHRHRNCHRQLPIGPSNSRFGKLAVKHNHVAESALSVLKQTRRKFPLHSGTMDVNVAYVSHAYICHSKEKGQEVISRPDCRSLLAADPDFGISSLPLSDALSSGVINSLAKRGVKCRERLYSSFCSSD